MSYARQRREVWHASDASLAFSTMLLLAWIALPYGMLQVPVDHRFYLTPSIGSSAQANQGSGIIPSEGFTVLTLDIAQDPQAHVFDISETSFVSEETPQIAMTNLFTPLKYGAFMQGRRNKLEIYAEILKRLMSEPLGVTEIALFCRLNFSSAKETVDFLISKGLLESVGFEGATKYRTSRKGSLVLGMLEEVVVEFLRAE